jgi:hypothetical protein
MPLRRDVPHKLCLRTRRRPPRAFNFPPIYRLLSLAVTQQVCRPVRLRIVASLSLSLSLLAFLFARSLARPPPFCKNFICARFHPRVKFAKIGRINLPVHSRNSFAAASAPSASFSLTICRFDCVRLSQPETHLSFASLLVAPCVCVCVRAPHGSSKYR